MEKTILITGGAGFIGSHVVRRFVTKYPHYHIVNLDALTYAGNLENLKYVDEAPNYTFVKGDITDELLVEELFAKYRFQGVIHLAAESHVDRSINDPLAFMRTNVMGTVTLLNVARDAWKDDMSGKRFYHISTDEVFGSLGDQGLFTETTSYDPRSPYSASKASSDHMVRSWGNTYDLPVLLTNCSNNYGPNQFPEKLIPLAISNIRHKKPIPIYGTGENIRDWLFVEDHAAAIDLVYHEGGIGETYNIGGHNEWSNLEVIHLLCDIMDRKMRQKSGTSRQLITFVKDRAGHDHRYAIDASRIKNELGWSPSVTFEEGLDRTVDWYLRHEKWLENILSGEYQNYYRKQYGE